MIDMENAGHLSRENLPEPKRLILSENVASPNVILPVGAITSKFGVFGVSGSGKTYTGSVLAEEILLAGAPLIVADPLGVWYGLRIDGVRPLPPIYILGGDHADLPLTVSSGAAIADLVLSKRISVILDMSNLAPDEQPVFMAAFCRQLYEKSRTAVHLIVDECDIFAPEQTGSPAEYDCRRALDTIVRRGRVRGIGVSLITQRPAVVAKSLVSQIGTLVVHRLAAEQDRKAIDGWVRAHGTPEERKRVLESLAGLATGEAWFWSPEAGLLEMTKVRRRYSFDSSATPEVGVDSIQAEVKPLTADDLADIAQSLAIQVEESDANDPAKLKAKIAELKEQLARRPAPERVEVPVETIVIERVEVPVVTQDDLSRLEQIRDAMLETGEKLAQPGHTLCPDPVPVLNPATLLPEAQRMLDTLGGYPGGRMTAYQVSIVSGIPNRDPIFHQAAKELIAAELMKSAPTAQGKRDHYAITAAGFAALGTIKKREVKPVAATRANVVEYWGPRISVNPPKVKRMLYFLLEQRPKSFAQSYLANKFGVQAGGTQIVKFVNALNYLDVIVVEANGQVYAMPDIP